MMGLYLISQTKNNSYDTYDSAVVCAKDMDDAKSIHPYDDKKPMEDWGNKYDSWAKVEFVECKYIGVADDSIERGVVCASFNAG